MSKIVFKISHQLHFDFQNLTLTCGVLVLTLVVIYLAKHSYSKSFDKPGMVGLVISNE